VIYIIDAKIDFNHPTWRQFMKSWKRWLAAASAAFICACSTAPTAGGERVVVFLKAKPGAEKGLLDVTREWMAKVRKVPGLDYADVNVQNDDPGMIVMYYHWRTKDYAEAYRHTDLYKQAGVALQPYVADRRIVQTTNMD